MNRSDLAGFRSGKAQAAARLRAESARVPSLARSRAGGNSISRTVIGFAIVTAEAIASLLLARLGAFRSWRGTPPFRREPKAACQIDFPPARMLLLAVLLLGVVEPRFAHGAEDEGPREKQAEAGPPPVDRESGASHQGTPSPVSAARPRGLSDALYMHVGIDLPALDATTLRTMRLQYGPDWLGPHRTLPESAAAELPGTWGLTSDGEPIWRVTIRSAQAAAIAIRFETFDADGEVWIYTHDGDSYAGPYSGRGPRGNGAFWSDPLPADTVTVEYFPRRRGMGETKPPFRIPKISHHARSEPRKSVGSPLTPRRSRIPGSAERSSLTPYKDATCSLEFLRRGGHDQERLVDAVAMMVSRRDTGSYQCTAFVLRNLRERDRTTLPSYYDAVFTSGRCIRNQREAVDATFYWKYRTSTCDGPAPSLGSLEVTRGARLWSRTVSTSTFGKVEDYALLLVPRDELPSDVYRAGWTTADVDRGEDVYTLGHPRGEPLRLSVGDVDDPDEGSWLFSSPAFGVGSDYGRVGPGTSGSPVFGRLIEDGRLLGILSGTSESWFQSREWVVHKYGSVRGDFRHLRNVERETQRVSHRVGADTHWFTFYRSNFLRGWVLNNKRVVESGDTVAQGRAIFDVELQDGRWSVLPGTATEVALGLAGPVDWDEQQMAAVRNEIVRKLAQLRRSIDLDGADASAADTRFANEHRQRLFNEIQAEIQRVFGPGRAADPATANADEEIYTGVLTRAADPYTGPGWNDHQDYPVNPAGVAQDAGVLAEIEDVVDALTGSEAFAAAFASGGIFADTGRELGISSGRIEAPGDVDWFRFETTRSTAVEIYTTGSTDTFGRLDNSASDDDSGDGTNFRIEAVVSAGEHLVEVSGYDSAVTGDYTLHVRQLSGGGGSSGSGARISWTNSLGMEFVWMPTGRFEMGSPADEEGRNDDEVQREVRIGRGFWMGKYEVTQGEWEAVMRSNPSWFSNCGSRCPVEQVSWEATQEFIRRLNERESGSEYRYRLPTEAEWEYAARAGTTGVRYGELDLIAWYWNNSGGTTHPVGQKQANAWGLHDLLGNVWEWVGDRYGEYPAGSAEDPTGPSTGSYRVFRGGGWYAYARLVRSALRYYYSPGARSSSIGFRLVRAE